MLDPSVFSARRRRLMEQVDGPVLLLGNGLQSRNLPMNKLPFRQDSTFLYFTGCDIPGAAAWLDGSGCTLFVPAPAEDDDLWHGPTPTLDELGRALGVDAVRPADELEGRVDGASPRVLAVADEERNRTFGALTDTTLRFGQDHGDSSLVDAVIRLRRTKGPEEIAQMREAARHSAAAHHAVMRATRPGGH